MTTTMHFLQSKFRAIQWVHIVITENTCHINSLNLTDYFIKKNTPHNHKYHKLFNENSITINYSWKLNIESIVHNHGANIMKRTWTYCEEHVRLFIASYDCFTRNVCPSALYMQYGIWHTLLQNFWKNILKNALTTTQHYLEIKTKVFQDISGN